MFEKCSNNYYFITHTPVMKNKNLLKPTKNPHSISLNVEVIFDSNFY